MINELTEQCAYIVNIILSDYDDFNNYMYENNKKLTYDDKHELESIYKNAFYINIHPNHSNKQLEYLEGLYNYSLVIYNKYNFIPESKEGM